MALPFYEFQEHILEHLKNSLVLLQIALRLLFLVGIQLIAVYLRAVAGDVQLDILAFLEEGFRIFS